MLLTIVNIVHLALSIADHLLVNGSQPLVQCLLEILALLDGPKAPSLLGGHRQMCFIKTNDGGSSWNRRNDVRIQTKLDLILAERVMEKEKGGGQQKRRLKKGQHRCLRMFPQSQRTMAFPRTEYLLWMALVQSKEEKEKPTQKRLLKKQIKSGHRTSLHYHRIILRVLTTSPKQFRNFHMMMLNVSGVLWKTSCLIIFSCYHCLVHQEMNHCPSFWWHLKELSFHF